MEVIDNMKSYFKLLRIKHYIKNLLIFFPLFLSKNLFNVTYLEICIIEFLSFSLIASSIYIFNDINDRLNDALHPIKKNRPIASGKISVKKAYIVMFFLILISLCIQIILFKIKLLNFNNLIYACLIEGIYLILNIFYSKTGKNLPVFDVLILAIGFVLRVYFGGVIIGVKISDWLYLTILSFSLYLAIGKRNGELKNNKYNSRPVLRYYNKNYLLMNMNIFLTLTLVFYSLWAMNNYNYMIYSIMILIFILLRYNLNISGDSFADPIEVFFSDKILTIMTFIYIVFIGGLIYA